METIRRIEVAIAQQDRQLRRQLADDFETDLKVVQKLDGRSRLKQGQLG